MADLPRPENGSPAGPSYSLAALIGYVLKLGATGFGGPVALVGYMHMDLVQKREWLTESDFKEGLTLAQLAPGPLAAQLAIYLGYCHYGVLGASVVGAAFVLPSFLMVLAIGWAYCRFGELAWLQAAFYTVGACIIGIIARSAQRLAAKTLGRDSLLWAIFAVVALCTITTSRESILLVLYGGVAAWLLQAPPAALRRPEPDPRARAWVVVAVAVAGLLAVGLALGAARLAGFATSFRQAGIPAGPAGGELGRLFWFFSQAGAFVFGSGLAIVPFLYGGVVQHFHWLTDRQFVDAVAVAMLTPGPVVITAGFIGYLVQGAAGACVAALATFLPCYLVTILAAPLLRRHRASPAVAAAVAGVTAAATGAIAGAVVVLGRRSVVDLATAITALLTYLVLASGRKVPEPLLVLLSALVGLAMHRA